MPYQDTSTENLPTRPSKRQLKLLDKISYERTDIMSFKFSRNDNSSQSQNYHLNYKAGQYAIVDLGTKEDPEGPVRSFTLASSPTEDDFILISTRIRDTPFKKKLKLRSWTRRECNSTHRQIYFTFRSIKTCCIFIWRYRSYSIQQHGKICYR